MKGCSFLLLGFLTAIMFSRCDSNRIFESYHSFNGHLWHKDSTITFEYSTDSIYAKNIFFAIDLRTGTGYPYRNVWVFLDIQIPTGKAIKDTVNMLLMDEQGRWLPHVSGGSVKESRHYYNFAVTNPPKGKYIIKLRQAMREENLPHMIGVGARIEKNE